MTGCPYPDPRVVLDLEGADLIAAAAVAASFRQERHGRLASLCWILNAKSGLCGEDCAFCSQSSRSTADIRRYPLLAEDEIVRDAHRAAAAGARRFSVVTSGLAVRNPGEIRTIAGAARRVVEETGLAVCASLGCVGPDELAALSEAGVSRYHHNLETAPSMWDRICTTRPYEESRRVILDAKGAGLEVCSGGIVGLGETLDQRAELLEELGRLDVDSVAINFHVPIEGTPLGHLEGPPPLDCLRFAIAARCAMPDKEIRICGGRERNLRDLQAAAIAAGAFGVMIGGYLTTAGRPPEEDLRMLADLGLEIERPS